MVPREKKKKLSKNFGNLFPKEEAEWMGKLGHSRQLHAEG